jgi:hypothetical protein
MTAYRGFGDSPSQSKEGSANPMPPITDGLRAPEVNQRQTGLPQTIFPDGHLSYLELLDLAQRGHRKFFDKFDKPREV